MPEVEVECEKSKAVWGASASAWAVPASTPSPVSLADVMSEELAHHLHNKELKLKGEGGLDEARAGADLPDIPTDVDFDTSDDLLIAQMLQKQFDKEYDMALEKEENHVNQNSKVTVNYSRYRMIPEELRCFESSDDEDDEYFTRDEGKRDLDFFETKEKELGEMPRCGFKKVGDKVVTKHDKELSQRENAKRIMEFPPGIHTGDGGSFDMQINNKVYNKIRNFSIKEGKRKNRLQDKEDRAVAEQALDPKTRVLLYKLVNGGVLDAVNGVISTGKEAVIMHADGGPGPQESEEPLNVPKECAVKVFKTTLNEFKTRDKYIRVS